MGRKALKTTFRAVIVVFSVILVGVAAQIENEKLVKASKDQKLNEKWEEMFEKWDRNHSKQPLGQ